MNQTITLTRKDLAIALAIALGVGYIFGRIHQKSIYNSLPITRDTSYTAVAPPPPTPEVEVPATPKPTIVYRDRIDTAAVRSARQQAAEFQKTVDSLRADRELLARKLEDHEATVPFQFNLTGDGKAFLRGSAFIGYSPIRETFRARFVPSEQVMPMVTETHFYHPPWWQKPLLGVAVATTVIAAQEKQVLTAAGGAISTLVLIGVDF